MCGVMEGAPEMRGFLEKGADQSNERGTLRILHF